MLKTTKNLKGKTMKKKLTNELFSEEWINEEEKKDEERNYLAKKALNGTAKDIIKYLQKYRPEVWGEDKSSNN
jgi:hypothetical protein